MITMKSFGQQGKPVSFFLALALAFALCLSMLPLAGCGNDGAASSDNPSATGEGYRQISQEEALAMMDSEEGYIILDVRTAEEFAQGHIPDALNIPVETIGATPPEGLPDKDQLIMVYCRSGNRSKQASEKLVDLGYSNVVEFGGINTWPGEVVTE